MNKETNFGIKLEDLVIFNQHVPNTGYSNKKALNFIRDGIDLFEIPGEDLGIPLDLLEQQIPIDIVASYIGLGHLLTKGSITLEKEEIDHNHLLSIEPEDIFKAFVSYGFNYTGTRRMNQKLLKSDSVKLEGTYQDRIKSLPDEIKSEFIHSLEEARITRYNKKPRVSNSLRTFNKFAELYSNKHGKQFVAHTDELDMRRMKVRSTNSKRKGSLYIVEHVISPRWDKPPYSCTCDYLKFNEDGDCSHIKKLKQIHL